MFFAFLTEHTFAILNLCSRSDKIKRPKKYVMEAWNAGNNGKAENTGGQCQIRCVMFKQRSRAKK